MNVVTDLRDAFDVERPAKQLDLQGSAAELRERWALETEPRKPGIVARILGVVLLLVAVASAGICGAILLGAFGLPGVEVPAWLLIGALVLSIVVVIPVGLSWLSPAAKTLDSRKRALVDALLEFLARELAASERVSLQVDFRSAATLGLTPVADPKFEGFGIELPHSEPVPHDWLRLHASLVGVELDMRVRTLVGRSGANEIRLRDEIGVVLVGEGFATSLAAAVPDRLKTSLLAHELGPSRVRFLFRGRGMARRNWITREDKLEQLEGLELLSVLHTRSHEHNAPELQYHDMGWLLVDAALVDHIEFARSIVRSPG